MKTYASVVSAKALPDFRVLVGFDTGASGIFDCKPLLSDPFWRRLSDPAFFRLVKVEYGTLVWPDDIDIAPEDVWEGVSKDPNFTVSSPGSDTTVPPRSVAEPDPPPYGVQSPSSAAVATLFARSRPAQDDKTTG